MAILAEEIDTIIPALNLLQKSAILSGTIACRYPIYTKIFSYCRCCARNVPRSGLASIKTQGFGAAANITLGLPIIRTSVDHGTALTTGTGAIDCVNSNCYQLCTCHEISPGLSLVPTIKTISAISANVSGKIFN